MSGSLTRETRIIAAAGCPVCGAAAGVDCREPDGSPVPWSFRSPPSARRPTMHQERRKAYTAARREAALLRRLPLREWYLRTRKPAG